MEAWVFIIWFIALYPNRISTGGDSARFWRELAEEHFLRLQEKNRTDQKQIVSKECVENFQSDVSILGHNKVDRSQIEFWVAGSCVTSQ